MVEMRWYTHPDVPIEGDPLQRGGVASGIRVLQYRLLRDATPPTTETQVMQFPFTVYKEWTEWMDVPEVSAE